MIKVVTAEGTFTVPGTAKEVDTSAGALKVTREGKQIAHFRRWIHWMETEENNQ